MSKHKRFHLKDLGLLRQELAELGLSLPIDEDLSVLAEPVAIELVPVACGGCCPCNCQS